MRQRPNHCFNLSTSSAPVQRAQCHSYLSLSLSALALLGPVAHHHYSQLHAAMFRNSSLSNLESRTVTGDIFKSCDTLSSSNNALSMPPGSPFPTPLMCFRPASRSDRNRSLIPLLLLLLLFPLPFCAVHPLTYLCASYISGGYKSYHTLL